MDSFPYEICRMCGAVSPYNRVWALKMPSFVELVEDLLQIKVRMGKTNYIYVALWSFLILIPSYFLQIKDTDKCSQLVCMQCVAKVKEFGLYAKQAKDLQKTIENYILFQEQVQMCS